jgi:hypothetical protein
MKTFEIIAEIAQLKMVKETTIEQQGRLMELRELCQHSDINLNLFPIGPLDKNLIIPYFTQEDVDNLSIVANQLWLIHHQSLYQLFQLLRELALEMVESRVTNSGQPRVPLHELLLYSYQLVSEALRQSDVWKLR